ncbi:MAG: O-antigen polymerase [Polaromonas sp.]|nr:O-antigen polymerase [Polaromonas sp.]
MPAKAAWSQVKCFAPFSASFLSASLISSGLALIQYADIEIIFAPWINLAEPGVAFANLRQRNQFASLTNIGLATLLAYSMMKRAVTASRALAFFGLAATGLLSVANAATASRTGLVQVGLLCVMFTLWGGWQTQAMRHLLITAVLTYALAVMALPYAFGLDASVHGMFARLSDGDPMCASRLTLWSNVLDLIAQKPWLGWGWGQLDYAHYITLFEGPRFCDILDNAHNLPLHLAVELGVPAALLICASIAWWIWRQRPWREKNPARQLAWAVLALIGLHSMLEYPLWYGPFQMAVGMCLWILWQTLRVDGVKEECGPKWPLAHICRGVAAILLIACGVLAWDYHRISQVYLSPDERSAAYRDDTLSKIQGSWFFGNQVLFAELNLTPLTQENAQWTFDVASCLLHFSPEPRVIEKLIESATLLGRDDEALRHLARYRAAFPTDHARWSQSLQKANSRLF